MPHVCNDQDNRESIEWPNLFTRCTRRARRTFSLVDSSCFLFKSDLFPHFSPDFSHGGFNLESCIDAPEKDEGDVLYQCGA